MVRAFLAAAAVALYFLYAAWPGLLSGFNGDDLMNMTFAVSNGWGKIIRGNLLFFSTEVRPLGAVYYLGLYDLFGMNPLPFRVVGITLLAFNLWMTYSLTRRLTGGVEAGLYATVLLAWHGNLGPLFFGSGNIYDVLAFTFYIGALLFYATMRERSRLRWGSLGVLALLQICALNSKEFTPTLPMVLLAYELLFWGRKLDWRAVGMSVLLSGVYTAGKLFGPGSMVSHPAYAPRLSLDAIVASIITFENDFTYEANWATPATAFWLVALFVGIGAALRNRAMLTGCALSLLGSLPVMLIAPRGLASHYLTVGGIAIWTGALLFDVRERLTSSIRATDREYRYTQAALFLALLVWMVKVHAGEVPVQNELFWRFSRPIAQALDAMKRHPEWWAPRPDRVLVVSDPFEPTDWASVFLGKLLSHNGDFPIDTLSRLDPKPAGDGLKKYGLYLHWDGRQFVPGGPPQ